MSRLGRRCLPGMVGAALLCTGCGAASRNELPLRPAALNEPTPELGQRAQQLLTPHFLIEHATPPALAHSLAAACERVYSANMALGRALELPLRPPAYKLEVCLFADHENFAACLERICGACPPFLAAYDLVTNRTYAFDLDTYDELCDLRERIAHTPPPERQRLRRCLEQRQQWFQQVIVQHEIAHHVAVNTGLIPSADAAPAWLVEGLAMLLETDVRLPGADFRVTNPYRLHEYRKLSGDQPASLDGVRDLLGGREDSIRPDSYALAWALTAHLQHEYPARFAALLQRVAHSELDRVSSDWLQLADESFGPIDSDWLARFHDAVLSWPLRADAIPD